MRTNKLKFFKLHFKINYREFLKTKQSIFKNTGGMKMIISLIEMIELNVEPFTDIILNNNEKTEKEIIVGRPTRKIASHIKDQRIYINQKLVEKIIKMMQFCYSILGFCSQNNIKHQEYKNFFYTVVKYFYRYLFKHIRIIFKSNLHKRINVNQLEFTSKLFDLSYELSTKISTEDLDFYIDLICLHGKYPEFIQIFNIIATNNLINPSSEISKKLLDILLNENKIIFISVFIILFIYFNNFYNF